MAKKRAPLGKEDVARSLEVRRKRAIVTEKFYPALLGATVSVDEAKMLIQSISSLIMAEALNVLKERKIADIYETTVKQLCPGGDREKEVRELLLTIQNESLFVGREIVEGMANAIEQMVHDELKDRTLNSYTPDWERYLNK